jgi:hypothetical protein
MKRRAHADIVILTCLPKIGPGVMGKELALNLAPDLVRLVQKRYREILAGMLTKS